MTDAGVGLAGRTQGLLARRSVSCNGGIVPRRHPNGGGADRPSIPPTSIPPSSTPVLPVIGAENVDRLSIASTFGLGEALRSLASSPDGTILALAGGKTEDFAIRLYDVAGGVRPARPASGSLAMPGWGRP
jgi:hypothetical protein